MDGYTIAVVRSDGAEELASDLRRFSLNSARYKLNSEDIPNSIGVCQLKVYREIASWARLHVQGPVEYLAGNAKSQKDAEEVVGMEPVAANGGINSPYSRS